LDEVNHLKQDLEFSTRHLGELRQAKEQLIKLENAEIQLAGLQDVIERIEQCTYEEKRLAFDALDIKVKATPEKIEISGVIPVDITSTQSLGDGQNPIHHWTNIGMFALSCVHRSLINIVHFTREFTGLLPEHGRTLCRTPGKL
jgi:hypothetical protein